MIPIGDDNRGRQRFPIVNLLLILTNIAVFIYQITRPPLALEEFVFRYGAIPAEITTGTDLPPEISFPVYLTVFTSMFLHGGVAHLLGNMLFLWIFGDNVEDSMGHARYLIFYLLGGVAAALAQSFVGGSDSTVPMVGASGAISAVMAGYLVLFPRGLVRVLVLVGIIPFIFMVPSLLVIGLWILFQFVNGFAAFNVETEATGGVAYLAHIGGFLAGLILIRLFSDRRSVQRQRLARQGMQPFSRHRAGMG